MLLITDQRDYTLPENIVEVKLGLPKDCTDPRNGPIPTDSQICSGTDEYFPGTCNVSSYYKGLVINYGEGGLQNAVHALAAFRPSSDEQGLVGVLPTILPLQ